MELVVVVVLFILIMIGLARPYIGMLALLVVMQLDPGELYPSLAPLHLERVVAGFVLIAFFLHGEKWRFPAPNRWLLAFYGAMILSIPLAFWRANSLASCVQFLEIIVYVMLATALLTTELRIKWFILTFVLLTDWLGGSALYNYTHGIWQVRMNVDRAIGITNTAGDPNTLALTLVASIPLAIALVVRPNPLWMRSIGIASIAMSCVTIVDTGSRGGAAGIVFLIVLLLIRKPKNLIFLPVLIALSPIVWMAIPQQYKARYETVNHLKSDASYQERILSWEGGIAMFESNPITGIGTGNYTYGNGSKYWPGKGRKVWLDAHSLYFKLIGELGLLGVFTFGGFVICVFRLNSRVRNELEERKASKFLQELPGLFSIIFYQLLFAGYASHDLYRSTWYIVGAMAASVSLLPILQKSVSAEASAHLDQNALPGLEGEWSSALLPDLHRQIPILDPHA